jgi:pyruvate dehydrogenase E2 component (dihydrolipoamide acetyltransferase)
MAREIVMPQLGLSMDSGRIAGWLKRSGDHLRAGEVMLEVESDKATVEVEAPADGILQIAAGRPGEDVKVGTVIAYLLAPGETLPAAGGAGSDRPPAVMPTAAAGKPSQLAGTRAARAPSSPAARRVAGELGVNWREAQGTGPRGRIKERDVVRLAEALTAREAPAIPVPAARPELRISPLARNLAESLGLDLEMLAARFPGERVEREDVELAVRERLAASAPAPAGLTPPPAGRTLARRRPMSHLRQVIAERMARSARTTAPVTLTTEVDATELVRLRETLKAASTDDPAPSYNVLLAKLVALALLEHRDLNATIEDGEIVNWEIANIGIAVDTERGLMVPVLRDVTHKSLARLGSEADDVVMRAQQGKALPDELSGGTFTITNLGIYGIDAFTPIINLPESAVLGVGRLRRKPVSLEDGSITVRTMLALSLTFDHRLVDGAPAARFLQRISQFIEQPYLWLTKTPEC